MLFGEGQLYTVNYMLIDFMNKQFHWRISILFDFSPLLPLRDGTRFILLQHFGVDHVTFMIANKLFKHDCSIKMAHETVAN